MFSLRRGSITWSCMACPRHDSQEKRFTIVHYDPGSAYAALLTYLIPIKRHINIDTLCRECVANLSEPQQWSLINRISNHQRVFHTPRPWRKQMYRFTLVIADCEKIMTQDTQLHLYTNAMIV
jgi:hypothetical protein